MPRKKKYKYKISTDILPCLFKHEEEWTCMNSQSEMFGYIPSNRFCNKCPFREEYEKKNDN